MVEVATAAGESETAVETLARKDDEAKQRIISGKSIWGGRGGTTLVVPRTMGREASIGGRVRIDRALDVSGRSAFYVIMFSWRHEGPMQKLRGFETKQLAWEHLQEYWGYRGHLPRLCDGSGVLPTRARKVRR